MARQKGRNAPASGDRPAPKPPEPHVSGARPPQISPDRLPRHVAIVMDGNGRWAQRRGLKRTEGHAAGEDALFDTVEGFRHQAVLTDQADPDIAALELRHRQRARAEKLVRTAWVAGRRCGGAGRALR